jgi:heme/copper-type cytochrome/quinol oxidase subunit 2
MKRYRKSANPFYALLIIAGIAFVVTAAAYCVMAYREREPAKAGEPPLPAHPLMVWMSQHGEVALLAELALLGISTIGAIGTDDYWQRRASEDRKGTRAELR